MIYIILLNDDAFFQPRVCIVHSIIIVWQFFSRHNPLPKYLCVILSVLPNDASLQTKSKVIQKDSAFITVKEKIKSHRGHQKNQLKPVKLIKYTKCEKIHKNMLVITAFKNTVSTGMFKLK